MMELPNYKDFVIYVEHLTGVTGVYESTFKCDAYGRLDSDIIEWGLPFDYLDGRKGSGYAIFVKITKKLGNYLFRELTAEELKDHTKRMG